ncbi:MAG: carboxypeptidase regulatory-like domain-containing protein, partial [Phaeodactylibacter sp.]|nr:carboxypeptidase regulatory-like domain-containing protein [Phaeodactylibacter sp.]
VTIKKYKTVLFEFDENEELRENATYIINFGDAIKDFTEGNIAPIRFIFSTGDYIDSLEVKGRVVDAVSGEPVSDVLVMLYDNLNDTVVRTERPFYFSRTDKAGQFKIENVKA